MFKGAGANQLKHLTLNDKGFAFTSFPVVTAGSETIAVTLATTPTMKGTFHFALHPATSDIATRIGCTPR